jgi:hypothetical protein
MENYAEQIEKLITTDSYAQENPEINELNVFSVSTLAYSWEEQVKKKFSPQKYDVKTNLTMFRGKAIHEWIQSRFRLSGWIPEYKIEKIIPIYPVVLKDREYNHIKIIGHADLYNPNNKTVIEIKTTETAHMILPYHILQTAFYAYELNAAGVIILINSNKVIQRNLTATEIENGYNEIIRRANSAWNQIQINIAQWWNQ